MSDYYVLNDKHEPVPVEFREWTLVHGSPEDRRVDQTTLPDDKWVSTVFLGMDHAFGDGPPLLFETMVFTSKKRMSEESCERYSTWNEAVAGHARIVASLKEAQT